MVSLETLKNLDLASQELVVFEAILRRASMIEMPFMLKGSILTRQYFPQPAQRSVADLDWIYMDKIKDMETAGNLFSKWMIAITETNLSDGIIFRSFTQNNFWRGIDYAMPDDFPTVNTDIAYIFGYGEWEENNSDKNIDDYDEVSIDISFNLDFDFKPIPLIYQPVYGEKFLIPYTPPLSIQIGWKLHQTVVRPRFKDLNDLIYLLNHPSYNKDTLMEALICLKNECKQDNQIKHIENLFTAGKLSYLYNNLQYDYYWECYTGKQDIWGSIRDKQRFSQFINKFYYTLNKAGINQDSYWIYVNALDS